MQFRQLRRLQSVLRLKEHMDRGTCPKDLRYDAKAKIYPDIKAIRKEAEQTFLHYRRIERNQDKSEPNRVNLKETNTQIGQA